MYLSSFLLDMSCPSVRQCLSNAHDMHRSIMSGFGDMNSVEPRKDQGVLYRLWPNDREMKLYVLTHGLPDWSHLSVGFSLQKGPKDISATVDSLSAGRHLSFDLIAVASKKQSREGENSRRLFLVNEEARAQWLSRKAEQNGFTVLWVREEGQVKAFLRGKGKDAVNTGVRFRGELCIVDAKLFQNAFCNGIGPGKAYGMGLLMLYPIGR